MAELADPPVPTLIFLHGHDDDPRPFVAAAERLAAGGLDPIVPTGPVGTGPRRSWWEGTPDGNPDPDQVRAALAAVDAIVDAIVAARFTATATNADPAPVILAGFSQGAALALLWTLRAGAPATSITALVAVAGWLPDVDGIDLDPAACRARRVLIAHGEGDDVVPLPLGRSVARLLERHQVDTTFIERPVGHELAPFVDPVRAWITPRR